MLLQLFNKEGFVPPHQTVFVSCFCSVCQRTGLPVEVRKDLVGLYLYLQCS